MEKWYIYINDKNVLVTKKRKQQTNAGFNKDAALSIVELLPPSYTITWDDKDEEAKEIEGTTKS